MSVRVRGEFIPVFVRVYVCGFVIVKKFVFDKLDDFHSCCCCFSCANAAVAVLLVIGIVVVCLF